MAIYFPMPFRFKDPGQLAGETQRIATEQIDRALRELDDGSLSRHEAIHQVRKRCMKLRGLLRLVRPGIGDSYKRENARFRDAARSISAVRDARVMVDTYDALMDAFEDGLDRPSFAPLRGKLTIRLNAVTEHESSLDECFAELRLQMEKARGKIPEWSSLVGGFPDLLDGMGKTYARGRDAMEATRKDPSADHFHEWRKRVKYHWHHCRLLQGIWPAMMKARARECRRLSEILGDAHDLAVFREFIVSDPDLCVTPERRKAVLALSDRRSKILRRKARTLGLRLFADKPGNLREQFAKSAKAWRPAT